MDTLLVVDDETSIQKSIERLFISDDSLTVLTASSAKEASGILTKANVDIIISDERMPQVSGTEFLRYVKEHYPKIRRIILTGYADQESTIRAINSAEVFRYLLKPWEPTDLVATVKSALEIKRLETRNDELNAELVEKNKALDQANHYLESTVALRTSQLKKTVEQLNRQYETLKLQQSGTVDLLATFISLHDQQKSRILKMVREKFRQVASLLGEPGSNEAEAEASDDAKAAAVLSVLILDDMDDFFSLLDTLPGFEAVANILRLTRENFGASGTQIPLASRLLRIVHDYCTIAVLETPAVARETLISQSYKRYDGDLVKQFLVSVQDSFSPGQFANVAIDRLVPGMILGKDLHLANGALLVPAESVLDEAMVRQLQRLRKLQSITDDRVTITTTAKS